MTFLMRCALLFVVVLLLGTPLASRQFSLADDVVRAKGAQAVVIDALANDRPGFFSWVNAVDIIEAPRYGTVDIGKDGRLTYEPSELVTVDSFVYQARTSSGAEGTARVVIERAPGRGVTVTAPIDLTAGGRWWWWGVLAVLVLFTALSLAHRQRTRAMRRHLER